MESFCILCHCCLKNVSSYAVESSRKREPKLNVRLAILRLPFEVRSERTNICIVCWRDLQKPEAAREKVGAIELSLKEKFSCGLSSRDELATPLAISSQGNFAAFTPQKPSSSNILSPAGVFSSTPSSVEASATPVVPVLRAFADPTPLSLPISFDQTPASHGFHRKSLLQEKGKPADVYVRIEWPSKTRETKVHASLESLAKAICRGKYKDIASAAWKASAVRHCLTKLVLNRINQECQELCSTKKPSLLRKTSKDGLSALDFTALGQEFETRMPLLYSVLLNAGMRRGKIEDDPFLIPSVCVSTAVLLKNRNQQMNAVQVLINTILQNSSLTSSIQRLKCIRLTTSIQTYYRKLDEYGKNFDEHVRTSVADECIRLEVVARKNTNSNASQSIKCYDAPQIGEEDIEEEIAPPVVNLVEQLRLCQHDDFDDELPFSSVQRFRKALAEKKTSNLAVASSTLEASPSVISDKENKVHELICNVTLSPDPGRKIIMDNIDYRSLTHEMTETHQNIDVHWVTHMATENRVDFSAMSTANERNLEDIDVAAFLPSKADHRAQRTHYITLVARTLVATIPWLKFLDPVVVHHIPHMYWKEQMKATNTTFLGVIFENENESDGMHTILQHLHAFTPYCGDEESRVHSEQAVVGDQLTVERGVNGLLEVSNGFTPDERLEGLHFEVGDFHSSMKAMQVAFDHFYSPQSITDKCTLYSDRVLIIRRNIMEDCSKRYEANKKFLDACLDARLVAAALSILGVQTLSDELPPHLMAKLEEMKTTLSKPAMLQFLEELSAKVVDRYVLSKASTESWFERASQSSKEFKELRKRTADGRFKCRYPGCNKTYAQDGQSRINHEASHGGFVAPVGPGIVHFQESDDDDDMLNYQRSFMNFAMIIRNFHDAISEGDGKRVLISWKFMTPYLKADEAHSWKYALEALYLIAQYHALLSPRSGESLIWNRFFKRRDGVGGNIPLDLALEHYNRVLKTAMRNMGANSTQRRAIDRFCKALVVNAQIMENYDRMCHVIRRSGKHVRRSAFDDIKKIAEELLQHNALVYTPGRHYSKFRDMSANLLHGFNLHVLYKWVDEHKRLLFLKERAR